MKVLFNYCRQPRAYADSYGVCLVELEGEETIQDVRDKFIVPKEWWEGKYGTPKEVSTYTYHKNDGTEVIYVGRLVVMDTHQVYLG